MGRFTTGHLATGFALLCCVVGAIVPVVASLWGNPSDPSRRGAKERLEDILDVLLAVAWFSAPFVALGALNVLVRANLRAAIPALVGCVAAAALSVLLSLTYRADRDKAGVGVLFSWGWFVLWALTGMTALLTLIVFLVWRIS